MGQEEPQPPSSPEPWHSRVLQRAQSARDGSNTKPPPGRGISGRATLEQGKEKLLGAAAEAAQNQADPNPSQVFKDASIRALDVRLGLLPPLLIHPQHLPCAPHSCPCACHPQNPHPGSPFLQLCFPHTPKSHLLMGRSRNENQNRK